MSPPWYSQEPQLADHLIHERLPPVPADLRPKAQAGTVLQRLPDGGLGAVDVGLFYVPADAREALLLLGEALSST